MNTSTGTIESAQRRGSRRWWLTTLLSSSLLFLIAYSIQPVRAYYHLSLGRRALSESRFADAMNNFQAALAIDPTNPETGFWLARTCRKTGNLAGVRQYLSESRRLGYPDRKRLEREWWLVLAENGRIQEVENQLVEMLMNPGDDGSEICDSFSKGYCLNLMFTEAQKLLQTWAADYPEDYRPFLRLSQIYAGRQQWALAIRELRQAQKRAPTEISVQRELGRCLLKNEEPAEAQRLLLSVIAREPDDSPSLMALAQMAFDRNDLDESIDYLTAIIARHPRDFPARLLLAKVCLAKRDPAQSVSVAESLVAEWPEDLNAHYVLAQSLRAVGRAEDAKHHFLLHAELDKIWLRVEALTREINQRPADPQLRYELGILLLRHVSREEGVAYLHSVFQFSPSHSQARQALADYFEKMGEGASGEHPRAAPSSSISSYSTASSILSEDHHE